jgi:hypothetical protein
MPLRAYLPISPVRLRRYAAMQRCSAAVLLQSPELQTAHRLSCPSWEGLHMSSPGPWKTNLYPTRSVPEPLDVMRFQSVHPQ